MRPTTLTMCAFGPFQGCETIHFDQLGDNPLFLINGPTGSGKTTILDAICFALYGRTTGDEREGSQMRCDHASSETLTEVVFSFELSGCHYRIRRVPEQQRPKARGEGTTTQSAEAQLWALDAEDTERLLIPIKVTEATKEIEQLTGLSVEQFRQVMVLPQGKFRDLLLAESKAREEIFSQLFQTGVYRQLEEHLKSQSAEIRRAVEKSRLIQQGILEGIGVESKQLLLEMLQSLRPEVEQAALLKRDADSRHMLAQQAMQQARNLNQGFLQLEQLKAKQAELERQQADVQQKQQRLVLANQANQIKPLFDELTRCREGLAITEKRSADAQQDLASAKQVLEKSIQEQDRAEQLAEPLDQAKQQLSKLKDYHQRAIRLNDAMALVKQAEIAERTAVEKQRQATRQLQRLLETKEKCGSDRTRLQLAITRLADTPLQLKQINDLLNDRRMADSLVQQCAQEQQRLAEAEQAGKRLAENHQALMTQLQTLEFAWHNGQAVLLAKELEMAQPCPVCGSTEHPAPAKSEGLLPTESELERAKNAVQVAQEKLNEARDGYTRIKSGLEGFESQISQMEGRLGDSKHETSQQLQGRHDNLLREMNTLQASQRELQELEKGSLQLKQEEGNLRNAQDDLSKQAAEMRAAMASARSELSSAEQELPERYRKPGKLDQAIQETTTQVNQLTTEIANARANQQQANGKWEAANATCQSADEFQRSALASMQRSETNWAEALSASPFDEESRFVNALIDEPEKVGLEESISAYGQAVQQTAGALHQQQAALGDQILPDMPALELAMEQATEAKSQAEHHWQQLDKRLGHLQSAEEKLKQTEQQCEGLEKEYRLIGTLSDVANGQTGDKISLQRFVLSVLLDDVLVEASQRLHLMSKGRYQLLRKEERAKGNRASGLDLEVEDAYTGKRRSVATLSGGESFLAALSLALGLSDVVQAYSGGIRLDTLFIDEGFGSLDPESLELAIRTLIDLQASGRMIGVISHVTELKEQMPLRLDIMVGREGSHINLVRP